VVSPIDALMVINYLNSHNYAAESEPMDVTEEFSADSFVQDDLLGLLAADSVTAKRRTSATR
jgi:hypothetical protein